MDWKKTVNLFLSMMLAFSTMMSDAAVFAEGGVGTEEPVAEEAAETEESPGPEAAAIVTEEEEEISEGPEVRDEVSEQEEAETIPAETEKEDREEETEEVSEAAVQTDADEDTAEDRILTETEEEEIAPAVLTEGSDGSIPVDEEHFPDQGFRNYVLSDTVDTDRDGLLSPDEREVVREIDLSHAELTSLSGIGYFMNLETLFCYESGLTSLDLSRNTALDTLECGRNELTELNTDGLVKLRTLYCEENDLSSLDLTDNKELTALGCGSNKLTELDVSENKKLYLLECDNNQLTSLDLSANPEIGNLSCSFNGMTELILPETDNLFHFESIGNHIPSICFEGQFFIVREILPRAKTIFSITENGIEYQCARKEYRFLDAVSWIIYDPDTELVAARINETNFPDETFRNKLLDRTNGDNVLTDDEISTLKWLDLGREKDPSFQFAAGARGSVRDIDGSGDGDPVTSLEGIEYLPMLEELSCRNNELTEIDLSGNLLLTALDCSGNRLTSLDLSPNRVLERVDCSGNELSELILADPELEFLECQDNRLSVLDLSMVPSLKGVACYLNQLNDLDLSQNPDLESVICFGNPGMTALNINNNAKLINAVKNAEPEIDSDYLPGTEIIRYIYNDEDGVLSEVHADIGLKIIRLDLTEAFPDENFRNYVAGLIETGTEGADGYLSVDEYDALAGIILLDCEDKGIADLEGIRYFPNLEYLECSMNSLTRIDLSANTALLVLNCDDNELTQIGGLGSLTDLESLSCSNNAVASLDLADLTRLEYLNCSGNRLAGLAVAGKQDLSFLDCSNNRLTDLNVTYCTALTELNCNDNELTGIEGLGSLTDLVGLSCSNNAVASLDLADLTSLQYLDCSGNRLTGLTVTGKQELSLLDCRNNLLTNLNVTNSTALIELYCDHNELTGIEGLGSLTGLENLSCSDNAVASLDLADLTSLQYLDCSGNQLTELYIDTLNHLSYLYCQNNNLSELYITNPYLIELYCYGNQIEAADLLETNEYIRSVTAEGYTSETDSSGITYNLYQKTIVSPDGEESMVFKLAVDPETSVITQEDPEFMTYSLVLSYEIGVNFYMYLPEMDGVDLTESYMEFRIGGKDGTVTRDMFDAGHTNSTGKYYGFTCYVNSIQMADTITAVYHYTQAGNDKTVEKNYSVKQYISTFDKYQSRFDETTQALVKALADYGHHMQQFLSRERNWTLGNDHAAMDKFYSASYDTDEFMNDISGYAIQKTFLSEYISRISYSLTLDSKTVINLYITPAENYSGEFSVYVDGAPVEPEPAEARYVVRITGLSAHLLDHTHTVIVKDESGTEAASIYVSALSYVNSMLNKYEDEISRNAAASLYWYSKAADEYKAAHPDAE